VQRVEPRVALVKVEKAGSASPPDQPVVREVGLVWGQRFPAENNGRDKLAQPIMFVAVASPQNGGI